VQIAAVACRNHPAREAIGVCVKCRARVCAECSTKLDGINHCVECLAKLAGAHRDGGERAARASSPWLGRALAGALLGTLSLLSWALLEVALPR
jgi:hypothetical protein